MILDVPLPGIEPWNQVKTNPALWHFSFHQKPDLPEQLINRAAIPDSDVREYAAAYSGTERLRAGLEFYRRAYPSSEIANEAARGPLEIPIVPAGGDHSVGQVIPPSRMRCGCAAARM
jgi:hypothetical protein